MLQPFDLYIDILKDGAEIIACRRDGNSVYIQIAERINPEDEFLTLTEYLLEPEGCSWTPLENIPLDDMA